MNLAYTRSDWRPAAVIFDCDGVLLDTETNWGQTQLLTCQAHGVEFTPELQHRMMGWSVAAVAGEIARLSGADYQQLYAEVLATAEKLDTDRLIVVPGAIAAVQRAAAAVPVGVASNSAAESLALKLRLSNIGPLVDVAVSLDDVTQGKPAPDLYLAAAERLGVAAPDCLALEDSPAGAQSAVCAGCAVLGFAGAGGGKNLPVGLTISSFNDPRFLQLLDSWGW